MAAAGGALEGRGALEILGSCRTGGTGSAAAAGGEQASLRRNSTRPRPAPQPAAQPPPGRLRWGELSNRRQGACVGASGTAAAVHETWHRRRWRKRPRATGRAAPALLVKPGPLAQRLRPLGNLAHWPPVRPLPRRRRFCGESTPRSERARKESRSRPTRTLRETAPPRPIREAQARICWIRAPPPRRATLL